MRPQPAAVSLLLPSLVDSKHPIVDRFASNMERLLKDLPLEHPRLNEVRDDEVVLLPALYKDGGVGHHLPQLLVRYPQEVGVLHKSSQGRVDCLRQRASPGSGRWGGDCRRELVGLFAPCPRLSQKPISTASLPGAEGPGPGCGWTQPTNGSTKHLQPCPGLRSHAVSLLHDLQPARSPRGGHGRPRHPA